MKRILSSITILLLSLFCMTSCVADKSSYENNENTEISLKDEGGILSDNITHIIINITTADEHYYKEFISKDDIVNIKKILSEAVGEEIQGELEATGGRSFSVVLCYSNKNMVISSYSDAIIQIGTKYYSVNDSDWINKILEYYETSEIVENGYT